MCYLCGKAPFSANGLYWLDSFTVIYFYQQSNQFKTRSYWKFHTHYLTSKPHKTLILLLYLNLLESFQWPIFFWYCIQYQMVGWPYSTRTHVSGPSTDVWLQSGADIIFGSKEEPGASQMWQNGMVSQKLADCVMRFYGSYVRLDVTLRHKS